MRELLACLIALTWAVGLHLYGPFSFVAVGIFTFTVYSLPALLGLVYPFHQAGAVTYLADASSGALLATAVAWLFFGLTLALSPRLLQPPRGAYPERAPPEIGEGFVGAALLLCVAGFLAIAYADGLQFFLEPREEQAESLVRLLWRWVNAVGFVAALLSGRRRAAWVFLAAMLVYFIAGDRTVVVVTGFCLLVLWGRGRPLSSLFRPRVFLILAAFVALALLGKPLYVFVKTGSPEVVAQAVSLEGAQLLFTTFEPFLTFNILDLVVVHDFRTSFWKLAEGVLGQFLLVPSAFGISGNSFNAAFTNAFVPRLTYGIAGNYWAQAWSLAGALGVGLFAILFGAALRALDHAASRAGGAPLLFFAFTGALFAVYLQRNALDNLLSLVRQLFLVVLCLWAVALALRPGRVAQGRTAFPKGERESPT